MKSFKFKHTLLATLLVSSAATPAQAGLSDAINGYFTFREEQKPLVAPNRDLPPVEVMTPHYDERRASGWSRYYTRQDIAPQKYIDDSSMVMRPTVQIPQGGRHQQPMHPSLSNGQIAPQADMSQFPRLGAAFPQQGVHPHPAQGNSYGMIDNRARINQAQNTDKNIYLGEAGTGPNYSYGSGQLSSGVTIDNPKYAWNEKERTGYATPRAGDYDYNPHQRAEDVSKHMMADQGYELTRSSGYVVEQSQDLRNRAGAPAHQGNMPAPQLLSDGSAMGTARTQQQFNGNTTVIDLPENYVVQPKDTLSGISEKDYIYGDWKLWPLIYDANKYQVNDPDLILPGQNLGIPRNNSAPKKQEARTRAEQKHAPYDFYDRQ